MPYKDKEFGRLHGRAYSRRPDVIQRRRAQRINNARAKSVARRWYLKTKYGLSAEAYADLLRGQNDHCAVCRQPNSGKRDWHVDHDHVNGRVRGILCNPCNLMLGFSKEDPDVLRAGASYIDAYFVREYATDYT